MSDQTTPVSTNSGEDVFHASFIGGTRWHGFLRPYFAKSEALRLIGWLNSLEETDEHWEYRKEMDCFVASAKDQKQPAPFVLVGGSRMHGIGLGRFAWEQAPDPQDQIGHLKAELRLVTERDASEVNDAVAAAITAFRHRKVATIQALERLVPGTAVLDSKLRVWQARGVDRRRVWLRSGSTEELSSVRLLNENAGVPLTVLWSLTDDMEYPDER